MAGFAQPGFVACIVHDNKVVREMNEEGRRTCRIPFGSEYKLRLKNTTSKQRAYVEIDIDGMSAHTGRYILKPGETLDLERFSLDGDLKQGHRFKFDRVNSSGVADPTSSDNGHVRVKFYPEMLIETLFTSSPPYPSWMSYNSLVNGPVQEGSNHLYASNSFTNGTASGIVSGSVTTGAHIKSFLNNSDKGATVQGSESRQEFHLSNEIFATTTAVVLDLFLKGPRVKEFEISNGRISYQGQGIPLTLLSHSVDANGNLIGVFSVPKDLVQF